MTLMHNLLATPMAGRVPRAWAPAGQEGFSFMGPDSYYLSATAPPSLAIDASAQDVDGVSCGFGLFLAREKKKVNPTRNNIAAPDSKTVKRP